MMSELSFSSISGVTTPVMRSRRISILPKTQVDLSSPTAIKEHVQRIEWDNIALTEELEQAEERERSKDAKIQLLSSQLASSSSSAPLTATLSSSLSTTSIGGGAAGDDLKQRLGAEKQGAKRLLHRLIARIEAHDPASSSVAMGDESRLFDLDQSLFHDPDRSVLAPSLTHLTTPNGKTKVGRSFQGDLIDDVVSLRNAFEEHVRKAAFTAEEQSVALHKATSSKAQLSARIEELESQLEESQNISASISERDVRIVHLETVLTETQQRETELMSRLQGTELQVTQTQAQLNQTRAKLDRVTAEQELTIAAAAKKYTARIEALQLQLEQEADSTATIAVPQSGSSHTSELQARLKDVGGELERVQTERDAAVQVCEARIAALEAELAQRQTKTSDLQSILTELQEKKERLHAIQLHNSHVKSLEMVLAQQERIVDLLERPTDSQGEEWTAYAQDLGASLAQLKMQAVSTVNKTDRSTMTGVESTRDSVDATNMTDAVSTKDVESSSGTSEVRDELITALKEQIEELEARVLRRNEQIGSLQRQLKNAENDLARTRTNQRLAEETVEDLDAEKTENMARIMQLEERIVSLESPSRQVQVTVDATMQTISPEAEKGGMEQLQASLTLAEGRVSSLTAEVEERLGYSVHLQADKLALESTIAMLTAQIHELETALSTSASTAEQVQQQEEEAVRLRCALRKAEDRLASTQLEADTLRLTLAEQRESVSEDADRIAALQGQLSTLESDHALLVASSNADQRALEETRSSIADLTSRFATVENEFLAARTELEAKSLALDELTAKHAELEQVLTERDAAISARNAEYWTLKEELAELQEEAERSRDDPAALAEMQQQLVTLQGEKGELQERVLAQEGALLRLKADLSSARSTEELLNEQYNASQRRAKDLESRLSQLPSSPPANPQPAEDGEMKEKLLKAESELEYLATRIVELEEELGRKADEIEEADSKILDALKESKKYATRYTKLSGKFVVLQKQVEVAEEKVKVLEGELEKEREKVRTARREQSRVDASKEVGMVRSGSGGLAGRKRSKPDEDGLDDTKDSLPATTPMRERERETQVKAVYAPSPSKRTPSSFTPLRRSALKSAPRSHAHAHAPLPTTSTPTVLGHGTPTLPPHEGGNDAGMVRSTSNPSELIAARLSTSPAKLLSDKTNLAPLAGGTSRLSSLKAPTNETALKPKPKGITSLLPTENRGEERKVVGGAPGGGGGAADFLAKIKAQRAQHRA